MTTTSIHVQLGTAFWLMLFVLIIGIVMWAKLGSEKMSKASVNEQLGDVHD